MGPIIRTKLTYIGECNFPKYMTSIVGRRMLTPYFLPYGSLGLNYSRIPGKVSGYPVTFIDERLDGESYILLRTIASDRELFDLTAVVIRIGLFTFEQTGTGHIDSTLVEINLDNLTQTTDFNNMWQIGQKHMLRDVIANYDPDNISHMYVYLQLISRASGLNPGNEWALSVLLESPEP